MSHGQSQMVKAATPLHKAMEYETCLEMEELLWRWTINISWHLFMTITLEYTNISGLLPSSIGLLLEILVKL